MTTYKPDKPTTVRWVVPNHMLADQQPAPGVAGLVEALEEIRGLPSVRQDEAAFIAESALAAYRKGAKM